MAEIPIRDVRVRVLHGTLREPIAMSFGQLNVRPLALVEVEAEDGTVGLGESWVNYPAWAARERVATIQEGIAPLLRGRDAADVGLRWQEMHAALAPLGRQWGAPGPIHQAISGADIALWDLVGKVREASISELLGSRRRDMVPVYASGLGPTSVYESAAECRSRGYDAIKLKVGFGRERDRANLTEARAAIGPDASLFADANQRWTLGEARAMAEDLREADVAWLEEPIVDNPLAELEALHERTGLAIATGENLYGTSTFAAFAASPAIRVLQPDVTKMGGLTEAVRVCAAAGAVGTAVAPHLYGGAVALAATLQLACARDEIALVELDVRENPVGQPLLADPLEIGEGWVRVPDGPGLGITLSPDAVARAEALARDG